MTPIKPNSKRLWIIVSILSVVVIALLVFFNQCGRKPSVDSEEMAAQQDFRGEIQDIDPLDPGSYAEDRLSDTECSQGAVLYIADGPGKPQGGVDEARLIPLSSLSSIASKTTFIKPISPIKPLPPLQPVPIDPPSALVQVLNPESGSTHIVGSDFRLQWTIDSRRAMTVDILFSGDGGSTYQEIAMGIVNENSYQLQIPNVPSKNCIFRINAWVDTVFLGYNHSPIFQVVLPTPPKPQVPDPPSETPPVAPPESPMVPKPEPVKAYPPSSYTKDNNNFIHQNEDATRWFTIDHEWTQAKRVVWQISRIPFPCGSDQDWSKTPGLLAWGFLDGQAKEFPIDFNAIMSRFKMEGEDAKPTNQGAAFETTPDMVLLEQVQREVYVRAIMLDEQDQMIGATRSEFQIVYGKPIFDQAAIEADDWMPSLPGPELSIKTTPGFEAGAYEDITDKGIFLYAAGERDWSFLLDEIPIESVEIDLQISTVPYKYQSISDFQNPVGLVYRSNASGLSYTTKSRYYSVSFTEFAPPLSELGSNTITYYLRAVCYVPGEGAGTVVPLISKTHLIHYTGDKDRFLLSQFDFENLPTEEVVVKSYVPTTDFWRYYPARWELQNHEEYFEVTRPIQAEEIGFYIKNHVTGDFLFPYPVHMNLYPNTTRAQYQAVVDRMLPPGAWFRLTITQSDWDALWNEFFTLLDQIYASIQQNYNGLKNSMANLIADRFAFLGSSVQSYIRTAVSSLIDYGLVSVGLPPSLPNFAELADAGLGYSVSVALEEAARSMGIPPEEIPNQVRNEIIDETKAQLKTISKVDPVNPLDVDYLKPAQQAMYQPAWVDVNIRNPHDRWSPSGTLTISYYPVGKPHFKIYRYVSLPIPSLAPNGSTFIRVHLKPDNTDLPVWKDYYWGKTGECILNITATYHVPDVETAAKEQGVKGASNLNPDAYVYDVDPVFAFNRVNKPSDPLND